MNWKTATILYDDIFGLFQFDSKENYFCNCLTYSFVYLDRDTISRVASALSIESASLAMSISLLKLNSSIDLYERRENIKKSLSTFPTNYVGEFYFKHSWISFEFVIVWNNLNGIAIKCVGKNFLVIATTPTTIIEVATELNMIDTQSQWMFLVSNPRKTNVSQLVTYVKEGGNVAIATNNTIVNGSCSSGEECLYHELLKNFAMSLSKLVREEEAIYSQISDEEWESIRLTKRERRDSMLEFIKVNKILFRSKFIIFKVKP